ARDGTGGRPRRRCRPQRLPAPRPSRDVRGSCLTVRTGDRPGCRTLREGQPRRVRRGGGPAEPAPPGRYPGLAAVWLGPVVRGPDVVLWCVSAPERCRRELLAGRHAWIPHPL